MAENGTTNGSAERPPQYWPSIIQYPFIFTIHTGEDIVEIIRVFFESHKHIVQSQHNCSFQGRVINVVGDISSPKINIQDSPTIHEGIYSIASLHGRYIIHNDGPVQLDHLLLSFQPRDHVVAGHVFGPLIAGCAVQATVSFISAGDDGEN